MSKILNRDEFGLEVSKFRNGEEVNEGLFQFLKSFFKQDWKDIKSKNTSLKNELEKIDKSLDGYTVLKRSNYDACAQYRQALCDFANALLDKKLDELDTEKKELEDVVMLKGHGEDSDYKASSSIRSLLGKEGCKDKALAEKIQDSADAVEEVVKKNPAIKPWADALKRGVKNLINDIIIHEATKSEEDKEKKKKNEKLEDENQDEKDELEEETEKKNAESKKNEDDKIKEMEKERQTILSKLGITPLKNIDGAKALSQLKSEFEKLIKPLNIKPLGTPKKKIGESLNKYDFETFMLNEGHKNTSTLKRIFGADKNFGFPKIIDLFDEVDFGKIASSFYKKKNDSEEDKAFAERIKKRVINIYFYELNDIYNRIGKIDDSFKDVPCDAVQAMYVGLALVVGYGLTADELFLKDNMELITKCCIAKDATLGYSFPLVDESKPDEGTTFVALMGILANPKEVNDGAFNKNTDAKLLKSFNETIKTLSVEILKTAEKMKEDKEKEMENEAKKLDNE